MDKYKVVEKKNPLAIHCLTWSKERGEEWIEKYGDSKMFDDKSLTKESFEVVENS
jgi:hypothetical protein